MNNDFAYVALQYCRFAQKIGNWPKNDDFLSFSENPSKSTTLLWQE